MNHKTNYWALLLLAIILWGVTCFIRKESTKQIEMPVTNVVHNNIPAHQNLDTYKDSKFNFQFQYPKGSLEIIDARNDVPPRGLAFSTTNIQFLNDVFPQKYGKASFSIDLQKNINPEMQSMSQWWDENGLETEKTSPSYSKKEDINISGEKAIKLYYDAQNGFGRKYYDSVIILIPHGTDIYEVWGYELPDNPDPVFTPADIQSAREYEKIFNDILMSFKFVDGVENNLLNKLDTKQIDKYIADCRVEIKPALDEFYNNYEGGGNYGMAAPMDFMNQCMSKKIDMNNEKILEYVVQATTE